jgi:single-strand DNA-binding protein
MNDLNTTTVLGRLVRDPELRYGQSGIAVASLTVAVNRRWKDKKTGQAQEESAFVPAVLFGPPAEWAKEHKKGECVIMSGRLRTDTWQSDGASRSRLVLIAEECQFVERIRGSNSNGDSNGTIKENADAPAADMPAREKHPVPF